MSDYGSDNALRSVRRGALLHRCAAGRVPKQVYRLPPQLAPDARRWMRGKLLSDVP